MRYSCSISLRELKNAIKIPVFLYLGGLGTKIRFSSRKKNGAEYWYRRSGLGRNIGSVCRIYRGEGVGHLEERGAEQKGNNNLTLLQQVVFDLRQRLREGSKNQPPIHYVDMRSQYDP